MRLQIRVLGPIDVLADGVPRTVPGLRRKAVLAVLALHDGEAVSTDRLVDAVWAGDPPPTAGNAVQSHVSYLRRALGREAIASRGGGYALDLGPDGVDLTVAERLIACARHDEAAVHLRAARALWRGRSLADVAAVPWLAGQADRLERLRLAVERDLAGARLAQGEHAALVPHLETLAGEHPLDEGLHGQLMLALYRSGRQSEALAVYHRLRHTLDEELGVPPGPAARTLFDQILSHDAGLGPQLAAVPAPAAHRRFRPRQLPAALTGFVGRAAELSALDGLLDTGTPSAVVISALSGTAGVGKTTLAVHWAHRIAGRFPDGQLFVNLRGYHPSRNALDPAEAVRGFLDAFAVPPERVPAGLEAQAALYRSILSGRRVLVVLDNARDPAQVRPLLPGSPSCLAVVTSRDALTGLVATEGAAPLSLDLLRPDEARALLAARLGTERIGQEPAAVDDIVAACARLPLALSIVAARAAVRRDTSLARLAAEVRDAADPLDAFDAGDAAVNARAVFSWSYRALSDDAATVFRRFGLHPGQEAGIEAVAALAGAPVPRARRLVAELLGAHLITEPAPGRFALHDLLRAYAGELARATDSAGARRSALGRLLDHYLHTALAADRLLDPSRVLPGPPAPPGAVVTAVADRRAAMEWFTREHPVLLTVLRAASAHGFDTHVTRLAAALTTFHNRRELLDDWVSTHVTAQRSAERLGGRTARADVHRDLGRAYAALGRHDDADVHLRRSLDLYGRNTDGYALLYLSWSYATRTRVPEAVRYAKRALRAFRRDRHPAGEGRARNTLGWQYALLGHHRRTLVLCARALPQLRESGDREGEAHTWDTLGVAHHHLGDHPAAVECLGRAEQLFHELGDRYHEADIAVHLGDAHQAAGEPSAARRSWRHALALLDELEHPGAEEVRGRLTASR
ncbi:AfsR/SARP family transcriptional regulator [Paractinoplanes brasiliensis]|uniref:DNA-binding SARP family transcriptional activator n=1 Tax=Paractinoplanes brasiliensis TaxID=52695 RepID=A0A4R6J8W9_9ACTN|nr:BTAD domain-containing putative transcriptional regulator [Actinoplanes brasiliensis]TDO32029.1 DNA-binding SARP family transcriptional activator [Actinoplanes brasiliensis]GID28074.1 SARP family transcriptional regulator [Actinoplanes brasiliensis]